MRHRTLIALVGIPAYAAFMVLLTPASFLANRAAAESGGRVHFSDARGALWRGSVRTQYDGTGGTFNCDRLGWRLLPLKVIEARIAFQVTADCPDAQGSVVVARAWSEWEASNGAVQIAARALPAFFPIVAAWRPEGTVTLTADGVRLKERDLYGPIALTWTNASVALSEVKPLGSYRLNAQAAGDTAKLTLATLDGTLRMSGQGEMKLPGATTFSGEARAEGANAAALEPILNLIGPRRPDGARSIEVRIR